MEVKWGEYYAMPGLDKPIRYIPFHEGQKKIWESDARFLGYISGKGAGKSTFAPIWLENEVRKNPRGKFIVCAPSNKYLEQALLPEVKKTFQTPYSDFYNGPDMWNETKKCFTLKSGGMIYSRSLDDPEAVNGIHAHAIVVDELGLLPKAAWDILESRVSTHVGRILATTTPYRKYKWLQADFIQRAKTDPNYFVYQMASTINPAFTLEEFERLRGTVAPWKFQQDYCGEFSQAEGLVYPELPDCVVDETEFPPGEAVGGIDFGFNTRNPFAAVAGVVESDGTLWLGYERYVREKTIEEHAQHLPKGITWYCDSSRPDCIRSLKFKDHYAKPTKKHGGSVEANIDMVTNRIKSGKLKIISRLNPDTDTLEPAMPALLAEADLYQYPSKDEESLGNNPCDRDNHACDALAYLCSGISHRYPI